MVGMRINMEIVRKEYNDLSTGQRVGVLIAAVTELSAKIAALVDIARRPADKVRGPKWAWVLGQFINGIGPAAYWTFGRK